MFTLALLACGGTANLSPIPFIDDPETVQAVQTGLNAEPYSLEVLPTSLSGGESNASPVTSALENRAFIYHLALGGRYDSDGYSAASPTIADVLAGKKNIGVCLEAEQGEDGEVEMDVLYFLPEDENFTSLLQSDGTYAFLRHSTSEVPIQDVTDTFNPTYQFCNVLGQSLGVYAGDSVTESGNMYLTSGSSADSMYNDGTYHEQDEPSDDVVQISYDGGNEYGTTYYDSVYDLTNMRDMIIDSTRLRLDAAELVFGNLALEETLASEGYFRGNAIVALE